MRLKLNVKLVNFVDEIFKSHMELKTLYLSLERPLHESFPWKRK